MINFRKGSRRLAAVALVAVVAVITPLRVEALAPAPDRALSFLHVGVAAGTAGLPQIIDEQGREILLRGVNVDGIVDYFRTDLQTSYPTDPSAYTGGQCPPDDTSIE